MKTQILFFRGLLVMAIAALSACGKTVPSEEPVRAVKVLAVGSEGIRSGSEYAAEVRPRVESRLGFRVAGKLLRRMVEVGQQVKAGQVLAQLDAQDLLLSNDAARAQLSAAVANRDLAAADFKRFKDLREQNFISAAELERRDANLKAAQAQLDQAQAQVSAQGNQASYATLVADAPGVITAVDAEPGQVLAAGTSVVRIAQDGPRDIVFSVPEDKVARVKVGSAVEVRAWASQSGSDWRWARARAGSADSARLPPASCWRKKERSRPFTTGARRARSPRLASSTLVLTAAEAGTRSLARSW